MEGSCKLSGQIVTDSRQGVTTQLCYGRELITSMLLSRFYRVLTMMCNTQ